MSADNVEPYPSLDDALEDDMRRWLRTLIDHLVTDPDEREQRYREIDRTIAILDGKEEEEAAPLPTPYWFQAQEWANWWAVDPNGYACWFEAEPILSLTVTYSGWVAKTIQGVQQGKALWAGEIDIPIGIDWRTLKQQRPREEGAQP